MRQVPHYLLIGNGRVSRHFQHYFSSLNISFSVWHRNHPIAELNQQVKRSTHILILIRDDAIESFIIENLTDTTAYCIHFSGSLVIEKAFGAHPLMTFSQDLYSIERYSSIHFVIDEDAPAFDQLLPGVPNTHVRLPKKLKDKYHALCVLSGNFSCMLWQKLFASFEKEFNIPANVAHPYLLQQTQNLLDHYPSALTGPLVRDDKNTIAKNISALTADSFQKIYQSFVECYQLENSKGNE